MGNVDQILAWVACAARVHKILAWVEWMAWFKILVWVAWFHEILAWVAWVEILAWVAWMSQVHKILKLVKKN